MYRYKVKKIYYSITRSSIRFWGEAPLLDARLLHLHFRCSTNFFWDVHAFLHTNFILSCLSLNPLKFYSISCILMIMMVKGCELLSGSRVINGMCSLRNYSKKRFFFPWKFPYFISFRRCFRSKSSFLDIDGNI